MQYIRYTRNLFLRGVSVIYLQAFIALYVQNSGESVLLHDIATRNGWNCFVIFPYHYEQRFVAIGGDNNLHFTGPLINFNLFFFFFEKLQFKTIDFTNIVNAVHVATYV